MRTIFILIVCFVFQTVYSQDKDSLLVKKQHINFKKTITEVVITGQLTEKLAEDAIHKIRVINSQTINSGIFQDLGSLLEKELNIRLSNDNMLGTNISIQAISGQNVKILIDDVPVIGRLNGNIDLSQINLNNIERIEIVEGPLSTIFGTDALAGTINIITKKDISYKKSFSTYYESIGKYNYDLILSNQFKRNLLIYQFGRDYFNGWSDGQEFKLIPVREIANDSRNKLWNPKEKFRHKLSYNIRESNYTINNHIETFYEKIINLGLPREPYFENAFDEYYHTYRTNFGSNININNKKDQVKILLAYNKYKRVKETFYTDLTEISKILVADQNAQDTTYFNTLLAKMIMSNNQDGRLKYQIGIDLQYHTVGGQRILSKYQEQSDFAFFSTIEYKLNSLIFIRPSARIMHNSKYNAPFIPALNILYDLQNYKLRLSYAKGFRAPNFKELFLDFVDVNHNIVGNNLLLAEESNNYHLSTSTKHQLLQTKINTDISLFYNTISNKIDLVNSAVNTEEYSYFNIDKFITKGISASSRFTIRNTEINFGTSYIGRYNDLYNLSDASEFNFSMDYNINAIVLLGNKNKLNIFYKNNGKVPNFIIENNTTIKSYSESYDLLDISLNRRMYEDLLIITLGAKNLFDVKNIKLSGSGNNIHSSDSKKMSVGYGRTIFARINFRL